MKSLLLLSFFVTATHRRTDRQRFVSNLYPHPRTHPLRWAHPKIGRVLLQVLRYFIARQPTNAGSSQ